MSAVNKHPRLLFIDGLRALAAIYVAMHHAVLTYFAIDGSGLRQQDILKKISIELLFWGHYAVGLFIVLSGFSLMLPVVKNGYSLKGGILNFYKRRTIRIIPPYYCAMALSLLFIALFIGNKTGSEWDFCIPVSMFDIVTHLLMLHDFFTSSVSHINHVFWSISVEYRIYLLFPILIWVWQKKGALTTILASVLISITSSAILLFSSLYVKHINLVSSGTSPYIILFTFGMLAADTSYAQSRFAIFIRQKYSTLSGTTKMAALMCFAVVLAILKYFLKSYTSPVNISIGVVDVLIGLLFAFIIFRCTAHSIQTSRLVKMLSSRPLVMAGTFSYSLYLIHAPLLQFIAQYFITPLHFSAYASAILLLAIGIPAALLFAWLFFLCFEKPFITMGQNMEVKNIERAIILNPAP